jgi:anti-sigma regulatory factor (Ser/Thr protein kinase)
MNGDNQGENHRRVLGRVAPQEFIGRADELRRTLSHPLQPNAAGLILLLAPGAGVSELLRQAYDQLFNEQRRVIPVYFALPRGDATAVSAAIEFLNTFLLQYVAFRRAEPELCQSSLSLNELLQLAPPSDYEWIEQLIESYNRERFTNDDRALIRWCLSAPQRVPEKQGRAFVMLDAVPLIDRVDNGPALGQEVVRVLSRSQLPYAIAGMRRQMLPVIHSVSGDVETIDILRLDKLSEEDGRALVEHLAQSQQLPLTEEVRDLLVQQFECSPFFLTAFLHAAAEREVSLTSYLACEQLYVDELMGGRINRCFSSLLEEILPEAAIRHAIIGLLYESRLHDKRKASIESWKTHLHLKTEELERILHALHIQEFITWDGGVIEAGGGSVVWKDYLTTRYRLEIAGEPRALVVADTITSTLKRAPHTMARYYRRVAAVGLRELLGKFDCQRVPAVLFDYARFRDAYKGGTPEEIGTGLDAETELIRLPQVVHVASCASYSAEAESFCDEERCVVAHAFAGGAYTDANQLVWLTAEIDSKLEADLAVARLWCERLTAIAQQSGFGAPHIWLIAREGFSSEASQYLAERGARGSSRQQLELLMARLNESQFTVKKARHTNEFEMVVPMIGDNELIVAHTVEEIARRLSFSPEAINQIKHAVVEAFINASEHSLSPDSKIYQRFRVEDDKLVITISSRGIVPASVIAQNGEGGEAAGEAPANRRGLGLSMIKSLMDEVEFERVDDGTSLRMTKYVRKA